MKVKSAFVDSFDHIRGEEPPAGHAQTGSTEVISEWVDRKTGAAFQIRDKAAAGPQGDFRVDARQAEQRFLALSGRGTSGREATTWTAAEREEGREEPPAPEAFITDAEIEAKIRMRALTDAKRDLMMQQTTETPEWAVGAEEGSGFVTDASGRVRDMPFNRKGLNEDKRDYGPGDVTNMRGVRDKAITGRDVLKLDLPSQQSDPVERMFSTRDEAQVSLATAFRNIFGEAVANHIVSRSEVDRRPGYERPTVAHAIMDSGFIKPWQPPDVVERPTRPDAVAYAVGSRAVEGLMARRVMPELVEMPQSQRDALTVAIGRAILHVVAPSGPSKGPNRAQVDSSFNSEIIRTALATSISPAMVQGLVPPEVLSAATKEDQASTRITNGVSQSHVGLLTRQEALTDRAAPLAVQSTRGIRADFSKDTRGPAARVRSSGEQQLIPEARPMFMDRPPSRIASRQRNMFNNAEDRSDTGMFQRM